jgi:predicted nucleotidyltransferase
MPGRRDATVTDSVKRQLSGPPIPGLVSAYVFGSVAERRSHRASDVDVGILLDHGVYPDARTRFEAQVELRRHLSPAAVGREVDVVVLNDASPLLARRIIASGERVICFDAEADHDFQRDVQLRAADLEPFLLRMRRLLLANLTR